MNWVIMIRSILSRRLVGMAGIALLIAGCNPVGSPGMPTETVPASTNTVAPSVGTLVTPATADPGPVATLAAPTPQGILVTAVNGNVFIRRGPDFAYNPVSVLMDGQSTEALARDVLSRWVQIPIPGHPGQTGWIAIHTHFVVVSGDVRKLREIAPADFPLMASLRNCTHHAMEADPGSTLIPALDSFPDNEVQINPGIYAIHDIAVDGSPQVMQVEVKEGSEIDIQRDGDGNHRKCPLP